MIRVGLSGVLARRRIATETLVDTVIVDERHIAGFASTIEAAPQLNDSELRGRLAGLPKQLGTGLPGDQSMATDLYRRMVDQVRGIGPVDVVIGMDPHKRSVTIEVMAPEETVRDDGPGRAPGNVYEVQRGRLTSPHRLFGPVTSRTRHHRAYDRPPGRVLTQAAS